MQNILDTPMCYTFYIHKTSTSYRCTLFCACTSDTFFQSCESPCLLLAAKPLEGIVTPLLRSFKRTSLVSFEICLSMSCAAQGIRMFCALECAGHLWNVPDISNRSVLNAVICVRLRSQELKAYFLSSNLCQSLVTWGLATSRTLGYGSLLPPRRTAPRVR